MACKHGRIIGRCEVCRMERFEEFYGVPEDHIDADASQKKAKEAGD